MQWIEVFLVCFTVVWLGFFEPINGRSSLKRLKSTFQISTLFYPLLKSKVTQEICIHTET